MWRTGEPDLVGSSGGQGYRRLSMLEWWQYVLIVILIVVIILYFVYKKKQG
jgi:lipoprotein signal peptidase